MLTLSEAHTSFPTPHSNRNGFHPESILIPELVLDDFSTSVSSPLILYPATYPFHGYLSTEVNILLHIYSSAYLFGQGWATFLPFLVVRELYQSFRSPLTTTQKMSPNDLCLMDILLHRLAYLGNQNAFHDY